MRKSRIGALVATSALASATILSGAGAANASVDDIVGSVDVFGSLQDEPEEVDTAEVSFPERFTMTGTAYDNCTVEFTLTSDRTDDVMENLRGDYRVGSEDPVMLRPDQEVRENVYRPVVGSNQTIENAINQRANPYDFATGTATVDLTEERLVPSLESPWDNNRTLAGVEPNESGTHDITFGVYQGSGLNLNRQDEYETTETITVQGCPIAEDDDQSGSLVGSLDLFGSLENMS